MGRHAHIEPGGYITIDVPAWLEPRTAGTLNDLTTDLHTWATTHTDTGHPLTPGEPTGIHRDWPAITACWLTARRAAGPYRPDVDGPVLIHHAETRLDAEVWIALATLPGHGDVAVIGINHDPPTVHTDSCTDPDDWYQADDIDILCPTGHAWTWLTGRDLLTTDLTFTTITAVFGPEPDAPFTPNQDGPPGTAPQILCPTCGHPCDVELPTL